VHHLHSGDMFGIYSPCQNLEIQGSNHEGERENRLGSAGSGDGWELYWSISNNTEEEGGGEILRGEKP